MFVVSAHIKALTIHRCGERESENEHNLAASCLGHYMTGRGREPQINLGKASGSNLVLRCTPAVMGKTRGSLREAGSKWGCWDRCTALLCLPCSKLAIKSQVAAWRMICCSWGNQFGEYCYCMELLCPILGNWKIEIPSAPSTVDGKKQASLENDSFHPQTMRRSELLP